jgi:hypothetical protein
VSVLPYRQWDPNRRFVVTVSSRWRRDGERDIWEISELWRFERGSGRELLAVTIVCGSRTRRMSQARLVNTMREVDR